MNGKEFDKILHKLFEHGVFASPESRGTPEARKHAFNSQRDIYCNEAKQAIKEELEKNIFISGTDEGDRVDKILSRLVSSIVGLKLANAKDYKEFVPTAKKQLQSLLKQAELRGRKEELDNLWLSHGEHQCRDCTFKQLMTVDDNNADTTVIMRRARLNYELDSQMEEDE